MAWPQAPQQQFEEQRQLLEQQLKQLLDLDYSVVAALAASGVPCVINSGLWPLALYPCRQCHSGCKGTCLHVMIPLADNIGSTSRSTYVP
jgi:hypothetical protein